MHFDAKPRKLVAKRAVAIKGNNRGHPAICQSGAKIQDLPLLSVDGSAAAEKQRAMASRALHRVRSSARYGLAGEICGAAPACAKMISRSAWLGLTNTCAIEPLPAARFLQQVSFE